MVRTRMVVIHISVRKPCQGWTDGPRVVRDRLPWYSAGVILEKWGICPNVEGVQRIAPRLDEACYP